MSVVRWPECLYSAFIVRAVCFRARTLDSMRIPFDLLAALLALESVRQLLREQYKGVNAWAADQAETGTTLALTAMLGLWLVVWLTHELLARRAEWSTRWGLWPQGLRVVSTPQGLLYEAARKHPLDVYARQATMAQFAVVGLYAAFLYYLG
jgi:hypothetical protein